MYSPQLIAIRRAELERVLANELPRGGLREYTLAEVDEFNQRFAGLFGSKGEQTRPLAPEEQAFVVNEQLLGKIDCAYFSERYTTINLAGSGIGRLYPLWESQRLILDEIGRLEWERYDTGYPDGVLVDCLKDRQVGASTLAVAILFQRLVTHAHTFGLLAADVPDQSDFMWDMFERMYDHLPWYMQPSVAERVKNDEFVLATGTRLFWGASKSTRGADRPTRTAQEGTKGQLGRGKTLSVCVNSELATWTNPNQIDTALDPAIPRSLRSFWLKESSANGRGPSNWWWAEWQLAKSGKGRARAIFIPWYAEQSRHHKPAPVGWSPSTDTLAHARRAEESGPRWMHRAVTLTRDQLYWYETERDLAIAKDNLSGFMQEHPADDDEAFQYASKSAISLQVRERIRAQARPMKGMIEVTAHKDLAHV